MPQRINPRKERRSNGVYWVVSLGRKYTGGCRQRRYFGSRKEAKQFVSLSELARHKLGCEAFGLPTALRAEAMACWHRLRPLNATLTQAVDFFLRNLPRPESAKSIDELRNEFLKSRKAMNCRPRTLVQYKSYLKVICKDFGKVDVSKLLRQDMEDWLEESEWSPRTRRNYLVTLTTILNFAVGKGYCGENLAKSIDRPLLDDRPVGILTVPQVKALLLVAKVHDPNMVPVLTIGLFAGLRRSEIFALDWSELNNEHRTIEVKGIKAKTRQRRLVSMSDNLVAWLNPHQKMAGTISPEHNIDGLSERLHKLAVLAGIIPWPHNAMRHCFGSYFLGMSKDENRTASEMGNSPEVVIKHYRALVREADVTRYWLLAPGNVQPRSVCG